MNSPRALIRERFGAMIALVGMIAWPASAGTRLSDLFGTWKIERIITGAEIVGLTTQEAEAFVGKQIEIHADSLSFGRYTCNPPRYERETQSAIEFRDGYKLGNDDMRLLELPNLITMYDTQCITLIPKNRDQLVMENYGIFFLATRVSSHQNSKDHNGSTKPLHSDH